MENTRGKFIVLEGGEGSGKSSHIKRLKEIYKDSVVFSREPGGSPYAEQIRNLILFSEFAHEADALTMLCLFNAARQDHMVHTIIPALKSGKHVICDRYDSSTFAYQLHGKQNHHLTELFHAVRKEITREYEPDIYIFLDVDIEIGLKRKQQQKDQSEINHFDKAKVDFHIRMQEGVTAFKKLVNHSIVDANNDFNTVAKDLDEVLKKLIG